MKRYQIALSSFDGISPQTNEVYDTREEAQKQCDLYNEQRNNKYAEWVIIEKDYKV